MKINENRSKWKNIDFVKKNPWAADVAKKTVKTADL